MCCANCADMDRAPAPGSGRRGQALGGTDGARGMRRRSKSLSDSTSPPAGAAAKCYGLVGSRSVGSGLSSARWRVSTASDLFTLVTPPGGTPRGGGGGSPGLSPTATADASALSSRRGSCTSAAGEAGEGGEGGAPAGGAGGVRRLLSRKLSGNRCGGLLRRSGSCVHGCSVCAAEYLGCIHPTWKVSGYSERAEQRNNCAVSVMVRTPMEGEGSLLV